MKQLLLFLIIPFFASCVSTNISAETSEVGESPLKQINQQFKIDYLNVNITSPNPQMRAQDIYKGINSVALQNYLLTNHSDYFSNAPTAFPVRINITTNLDGRMSPGFFVMYMCSLGILPGKIFGDMKSQIDIAPAYSNHASMFRFNSQHKVDTVTYLTVFSPIGWMMGDEPQGDHQRLSHSFPAPPEEYYTELYNKFVAQRIISELSKLKLEVVSAQK